MTPSTRLRSSDIWLQRSHTPCSMISSRLISMRSVKEIIEFVGDGKEIPHGNNTDHLLVLIDNGESPYLVLHHHMGCIADCLIRTHRNEWRAHDFVHVYCARFEILCHHLAVDVFLGNNADGLVVI